jgi:hypothetical protein
MKIPKGHWRHQAAIIYESAGTGHTEDDRLIGWAGGHDYAGIICEEHNKVIEKLKKEFNEPKSIT